MGGTPQVVRDTMVVRGIEFRATASWHDNVEGKKRGPNTIFRFELDGMVFVHMGDFGQDALTAAQKAALGRVDVLMIPTGGFYTIDAAQADQIARELRARVAIAMHYKTPETRAGLNIAPLEEVERMITSPKKLKGHTEKLHAAALAPSTEFWFMKP